MSMWRWFFYFFLSAFSLFVLVRTYYFLTDDFRISNISYDLSGHSAWEVPPQSFEEHSHLKEILHQPFYYIGKGAQCYAFESQDHRYILKFFKFKHLKTSWWTYLIPSIGPLYAYKIESIERKKRKLESLFEGYLAAYLYDRDFAGLLYLHLTPTHQLHEPVTVFDKIGRRWSITLDDVVFLLQKKGETLKSRLDKELTAGEIEVAKQSLTQILGMYLTEYQRGLYDRDHGVMHNTGFVEDKPFHLDVGKLSKDQEMTQLSHYKKDLFLVMWRIDSWIKNHYPSLHQGFSAFLADQYQKIVGEPLDLSQLDLSNRKKRKVALANP